MCDCKCSHTRANKPRLIIRNGYGYTRTPISTPQTAWHGRNLGEKLFDYGTHGSYGGRNKSVASSNRLSPYRCTQQCSSKYYRK